MGQASKPKRGQSSGGISKDSSKDIKDAKTLMEEARAQQQKEKELNSPETMETDEVVRQRVKAEKFEDLFVQQTKSDQSPVSL